MGQYDKYICTTLEKRHLLPGPTPEQRDRLAAQGKRNSMEHLHETPGTFPHVHGFPELLSWWGTNPDDFGDTDPMGMQMDDEIIPLASSWVAYIPANLPHMPVFRAGVRSQKYTRPTLHWVSGPGGVYTREKDDKTKEAEAEKKAPPVAREVDPANSKYARYMVFGTPPDIKRPDFMRPLNAEFSRPMAYIDQTVIPDAEFGFDTRWLLPAHGSPTGQVIMDAHALPYGTSIACIAMNYGDITDLCAEVELWIGGEKHVITRGFWAYIPPNVLQGPMMVRNVSKQVFFMMSWPLGEGIRMYPGGQ